MVHEPRLKPLLTARRLARRRPGAALIDAANGAGGRDNITVVLFRLEEVDGRRRGRRTPRRSPTRTRREYETFEGEAVAGAAPGRHAPARAAPTTTQEAELPARAGRSRCRPCARARSRSTSAARTAAARLAAPAAGAAGGCCAPGRSSPCCAVIGVLIAALDGDRQVWFLGTDAAGRVALYHGLPYELPLGVKLYRRYAALRRDAAESVPPARRRTFTDHKLRSRDDAENLAAATLENGRAASERAQPRAAGARPGALLLTAGFAAVFIQRSNVLSQRLADLRRELPRRSASPPTS